MRFSRNLASLHNDRHPPRLIPAPNHFPVARRCNRRGACAARPKGKYSRGRMALAPIRARRIFPATGHKTAVPPASLIQLAFTSHTAFFGTFLGSKKVPYPSRSFVLPVPPSSFSCKHPLADIDNPRNFGYAIHVTKVLNYVIITNAYRKE